MVHTLGVCWESRNEPSKSVDADIDRENDTLSVLKIKVCLQVKIKIKSLQAGRTISTIIKTLFRTDTPHMKPLEASCTLNHLTNAINWNSNLFQHFPSLILGFYHRKHQCLIFSWSKYCSVRLWPCTAAVTNANAKSRQSAPPTCTWWGAHKISPP